MSENFALTTMQAANELHVSIGTLLRWVREGRVPACKIGDRKYLFSRKALENLLFQSQSNPPAAPTGTAM
jgi:excisionase family DNA binding protein